MISCQKSLDWTCGEMDWLNNVNKKQLTIEIQNSNIHVFNRIHLLLMDF